MRISASHTFEGPSVHCHRPVIESLVDLEDLTDVETTRYPDLAPRLLDLMPGLRDHHCGLGYPGGLVTRLRNGTLFGHVAEHLALEFQHLVGDDVRYGKTRSTRHSGVYRVVIEYRDPVVAQRSLAEAIRILEALRQRRGVRFPEVMGDLVRLHGERRLGPSTSAIWEAARARHIPVRRLDSESLLELGYGIHRRRIEASILDSTSAVAVDIAQDKGLTDIVLAEAAIPVPESVDVTSSEEAVLALARLGGPVVVKPRCGRQGRAVTLGVTRPEEARRAFREARALGFGVLVQREVTGVPVRVLVVGGRAVATARRYPARVRGDGHSTVSALIQVENARPEREPGHAGYLTRIDPLEPEVARTLRAQGLSLSFVPALGQDVDLRLGANLSTGGTAEDITDVLHSANAALAERAARAVGLDVAGVDLILGDPLLPYREAGGVVLEVNAAPGLRMHLRPSVGLPRPVAEAIVRELFPPGSDGRIPIAAITGTNGKTTVTRLVAHMLAETGRVVGATTTDGVFVGSDRVLEGDTTGPRSARAVLSDPRVEVAVLEVARGGIRRRGLAFDRVTVGAVLNVTGDHVGQDGIETLEELAHVKRLVVECVMPEGTAVLNACDPLVRDMASYSRGRTLFFSSRRDDPVVAQHARAGGEALILRDGFIVHLVGGREEVLCPIRRLGFTFAGASAAMTENALAAAAIGYGMGLSTEEVVSGMKSFPGGSAANPGRMNLLRVADRQVLLDYGHNAPAVAAVAEVARSIGQGRVFGVVCSPGDRRDQDIRALGEVAGRSFDRIWIKEDRDRRGRPRGEGAALIWHGARLAGLPENAIEVCLDEAEAVHRALESAGPPDLVVILYESFAAIQVILEAEGRMLDTYALPAAVDAPRR